MKIICVGHAAWDITIPIMEFPVENTKNRYMDVVECSGGPAFSASYLLGKWGMMPYFIGTVGNDSYGESIIESLHSVSVNTEFIKVVEEATTRSMILANRINGSRTILTYQNGDICFKNSIFLPFQPDIMLFDGQEYIVTKNLLRQYPNCIAIMDAGRVTPHNVELASLATYVVCSREFAEELAHAKFNFQDFQSLTYIYRRVKEYVPGILVITLGKYGSIYEKNHQVVLVPSIEVNTVDSTGAGDIFHGAFVYGVAKGMLLDEIIKFSTVVAGLSVQYIGVQNSIVSLEEVRERLYEVK